MQGFVLEPDGILVSARPRPSPVTEEHARVNKGKRTAADASLEAGGASGGRKAKGAQQQAGGEHGQRRQRRRAAASAADETAHEVVAEGGSGSGSTPLLHDLEGTPLPALEPQGTPRRQRLQWGLAPHERPSRGGRPGVERGGAQASHGRRDS